MKSTVQCMNTKGSAESRTLTVNICTHSISPRRSLSPSDQWSTEAFYDWRRESSLPNDSSGTFHGSFASSFEVSVAAAVDDATVTWIEGMLGWRFAARGCSTVVFPVQDDFAEGSRDRLSSS